MNNFGNRIRKRREQRGELNAPSAKAQTVSFGHTKRRALGVYLLMGEMAVPPKRWESAASGLSFAATAFTVLLGYLLTLAPQVTLGFAGIFATAAVYGGVPHPPGYPVAVWWQQAFVM